MDSQQREIQENASFLTTCNEYSDTSLDSISSNDVVNEGDKRQK